MNRRGFLGTMLAACAAPAVVRAESLMRVKPIVLAGDAEYEFLRAMLKATEEMMMFGSSATHLSHEEGHWKAVRVGLPSAVWRTLKTTKPAPDFAGWLSIK